MTASDIIAAMGGRLVCATITGCTPNAVSQWRRVGIPPIHWPAIVAAAEAAGVEHVTTSLLRHVLETHRADRARIEGRAA